MLGASLAAVITNVVYAFVCIYLSKIILKVRMIDVVPFWYLYKIAFIAAAIMFPFYFLSLVFDAHFLKLFLAAIYVPVCVLILYKIEAPKKTIL